MILVAQLEVAPRLQPALELPVKDQEQALPIRTDHEATGREMTGRQVVAAKRLFRCARQELLHALPCRPLVHVPRLVGRKLPPKTHNSSRIDHHPARVPRVPRTRKRGTTRAPCARLPFRVTALGMDRPPLEQALGTLEDLGYTEFFQRSLERDAPGCLPGRIVGQHRRQWDIAHAGGVERAVLAGRRFHARSGQKQDEIQPTIGDWVGWQRPGEGQLPVIEHVLERRTFLARTSAKLRGLRQVIVANVDLIAVVAAFSPPDSSQSVQQRSLHPRRIERFLTAIRPGGARPIIVLNKADLVPDAQEQAERLAERTGTPTFALSAFAPEGVSAIVAQLAPGETIGFVGQSGVGKSSLVNRLLGQDVHKVGSLREEDARGRHTTTHRSLLLGPGPVLVIDTPGLRELSISDGRMEDLAAFEDIEQLAATCKFRDCTHKEEPGCQVRRAVEGGELSADRLRSYLTLADEVKATAAVDPTARLFARTKEAKRKVPKRQQREPFDD